MGSKTNLIAKSGFTTALSGADSQEQAKAGSRPQRLLGTGSVGLSKVATTERISSSYQSQAHRDGEVQLFEAVTRPGVAKVAWGYDGDWPLDTDGFAEKTNLESLDRAHSSLISLYALV